MEKCDFEGPNVEIFINHNFLSKTLGPTFLRCTWGHLLCTEKHIIYHGIIGYTPISRSNIFVSTTLFLIILGNIRYNLIISMF